MDGCVVPVASHGTVTIEPAADGAPREGSTVRP